MMMIVEHSASARLCVRSRKRDGSSFHASLGILLAMLARLLRRQSTLAGGYMLSNLIQAFAARIADL
jgi:hypothetical protein